MNLFELLWTDENRIRFGESVRFAARSEHLIDCLFTLLVPDFFKPASAPIAYSLQTWLTSVRESIAKTDVRGQFEILQREPA